MLTYFVKRVMIMIPTLFAIMIISFLISRSVPGDPVAREMNLMSEENPTSMERARFRAEYKAMRTRLGLDMPMFYFSLRQYAYPDTLYRIMKRSERDMVAELISVYGNWPQISDYYHRVCALEESAFLLEPPDGALNDFNSIKLGLTELRETGDQEQILFQLHYLDTLSARYPRELVGVRVGLQNVRASFARVEAEATPWKLYIPVFSWNGAKNQFHHWISQMLSFDFGRSYVDRMDVGDKISAALPWSLSMGLVSFALAYLFAIPIGVFSVRNRYTWQDQTLTTFIFLLYSIPSFVMAMLLMTFFCNPDYFYLFPTGGVISDGAETLPWFPRMLDYLHHLTLPTLVYTYGAIAFLSRQMRAGMIEEVNKDYIRTARAKGLSQKTVIWRHAMRNSLLPLITHFATLFPRLVTGAVIIESIFSIPGMGRLIVSSSIAFDHPTVVTVFAFAAIMTLLGILVSDLLYALADPRIKFSRK